MGSNKLKMNGDKTQLILLVTQQKLVKIDNTPISLLDRTVIDPSMQVRTLGVILDNKLTMLPHANNVVRGCFYHLRRLRSIWSSLTDSGAKTTVHALIASRMDYCNSVLFGVSVAVSQRLQSVFNSFARLITSRQRFDLITPALRDEYISYLFSSASNITLRFWCSNASLALVQSIWVPCVHMWLLFRTNACFAQLHTANTYTTHRPPQLQLGMEPSVTSVKNSSLKIGQFKSAFNTHLFNAAYDF